MADLNFDRLHQFFCKVPSVQEALIDAYGSDGQHTWWFKFQINIEHPLAWQTVQELAHVLNYISKNERLPTQFLPVSPPPYMNGGVEFLSWVIESTDQSFSPDTCVEWLEGRLPQPVDDLAQWDMDGE